MDNINNTPDVSYSPSWLSRLRVWITGLPGPWLLPYLLLALVLLVAEFVLLDVGLTNFSLSRITPATILYAFLGSYVLAFVHFLAARAGDAVDELLSVIPLSQQQGEAIKTYLTTSPRRPTLFFTIGGFATFLVLLYERTAASKLILANTTSATAILRLIEGAFFWTVSGGAIFFILHQLRAINEVNSEYLPVSLNLLQPLYALSAIPMLTSVGVVLELLPIFLSFPSLMRDPLTLVIAFLLFIFSLTIIIAPLRNVHKILEREKLEKQTQNAISLDHTIEKLHAALAAGKLKDVNSLEKAASLLYRERDELKKSPTWPWRPGALRNASATLALPMIIWLLQRLLDRFF